MSKKTAPSSAKAAVNLDQEEDFDTRFKVVEPGFSAEQDKIHEKSLVFLRDALKRGEPWKTVTAQLDIKDPLFKTVILDDCLKILLAERHFQGGEEIHTIALELQVPVALLLAVKEDMIREVKEASIQAYHLSQPEEK